MTVLDPHAIPVLEINGEDYWLKKEGQSYVFCDTLDEPIVIAEQIGHESWLLRTMIDSKGHFCREGDAWVLYEGPIRTRHVFTNGLDNSMIQAAAIFIRQEVTR